VDGFRFAEKNIPLQDRPEMDQWIISSLNSLILKCIEYFDDYEPTKAGRAIDEFVDEHLSNWYVRLCRRRFWKGEYEQDKISAYQTLYECMITLCKLMAPISPFFPDWLYQQLNAVTQQSEQISVHLCDYPQAELSNIQIDLEEEMKWAQEASSLILSLRKKANIKVRQPLQKVLIPAMNAKLQEQIQAVEEIIKSEVNIKEIEFIAANNQLIRKKVKANFKELGAKMGTRMKEVAQAIALMSQEDISLLEMNSSFDLSLGQENVTILIQDVEISSDDIPGMLVGNKGMLTVALDIQISPELEEEGLAREFVNKVQKIRKDNDFALTDRIQVVIEEHEMLKSALNNFNSYICTEILADKLDFSSEIQHGTEIEVNDQSLKILISKN
jgi:isoleucyl-tRNA synthetase